MNVALRMLMHGTAAAVLFFLFQRFALASSLNTSALWALAGAIGAAVLAWSQHRHGR